MTRLKLKSISNKNVKIILHIIPGQCSCFNSYNFVKDKDNMSLF